MLDADALDGVVQDAWGAGAPATWNRHVATARSVVAFCRRRGWLVADVTVGAALIEDPALQRAVRGLEVPQKLADAVARALVLRGAARELLQQSAQPYGRHRRSIRLPGPRSPAVERTPMTATSTI